MTVVSNAADLLTVGDKKTQV